MNTQPVNKDFEALKDAGFDSIYTQTQDAMRFFKSDPAVCCARFRYALEAALEEVYLQLDVKSPKANADKIRQLKFILPRSLKDKSVIEKMDTLREVSNHYHHYPQNQFDPEKDKYECKNAMIPIAKWVVNIPYNMNKYTWRGSTMGHVATTIRSTILSLGSTLANAFKKNR